MPLLAEYFVQLSAKGGAVINKEIGATGEYLKKAEKDAKTFEDRINKLALSFAGVTAGVTAFVMKGLQGTVEGEKFAAAFQLLAETIASLFLPIIDALTDAMVKLSEWLDELSNEGVAAIMAFGAAVALAMAYATGGISLLITGIALLIGAITMATAEPGKRRVTPIGNAGGFEKPEDTFKRMQLGIVGGDTQQQQLVAMRENRDATNRVETAVRQTRVAIA